MKLHFIGIAGSGMSALAQLVRAAGHDVSGSDRSLDRGEQPEIAHALQAQGIALVTQDGRGIGTGTEEVIFSTAVEKDNPDFVRAAELRIPLVRRAALLARLFDAKFGIAIAGTSGKSTVAAMVATVLDVLGKDATYYGGGALILPGNGQATSAIANARSGRGQFFCAETDESDGSFLEFHPQLSVITNITKDHKTLKELLGLFSQFMRQTQSTLVLNADCPVLRGMEIPAKKVVWYGMDPMQFPLEIEQMSAEGTTLRWKNVRCAIFQPGMHNVSNALAALTAAESLDIPLADAAQALGSFHGIRRRMELVGKARGIHVFDDFAHNPAKIEAALTTLQNFFPRVVVVFQIHGFGPARFMKEDLQELFARLLREKDILILPKIYDAGGTAERSICAEDIREGIIKIAPSAQVHSIAGRPSIVDFLKSHAQKDDAIVVMGARDTTLSDLCKSILKSL